MFQLEDAQLELTILIWQLMTKEVKAYAQAAKVE